MRFQTGVHTASAPHKKPAKTDVGAGYVYERTDAEVAPAAMSSSPGAIPLDVDQAQGAYLELSRAVTMNRTHRTWLGLRSEVLWHDSDQRSLGVSSRIAWELFGQANGTGAGDSSCGFVAGAWTGTSAVGMFVETGARVVEGAPTELVATAGLSLRLPLIFAFGMDLCAPFK